MKLTTFPILLFLFSIYSCQKNSDVSPNTTQDSNKKTITYIYKDSSYSLSFSEEQDTLILLPGEDNEILNRVLASANSQYVKLDLNGNDSLFIFECDSEMDEYLTIKYGHPPIELNKKSINPNSRISAYCNASVQWFEGLECGNAYTKWSFWSYHSSSNVQQYNYLVNDDVNDKISSFKFKGCDVQLFSNFNYSGQSLFIGAIITPDGWNYIGNLKHYTYGGFWGTKYNWNDKISSYKLYQPYSSVIRYECD